MQPVTRCSFVQVRGRADWAAAIDSAMAVWTEAGWKLVSTTVRETGMTVEYTLFWRLDP